MNTQYAWSAGFFDGEGWVGRTSKNSVAVQVSQAHPEVLEELVKLYGGKIYGPYKTKTAKKPIYRWCVYGEEKCYLILEKMWPYLKSVKRAQARMAIPALYDLHIGPKRL